ncbi:hypothetical protein [Loigolactobacillus rennini]|uniref:Uncharacterized protein n=1 Tax=Loigolactobacillus rennini DSM 20253 TaxID=1423796 RepID=A0A0R2CYY9_9LACO|nr:hypothetical protein [Loigolactobacillus rennini]KRM94836.1 hypothetical protein FC24_GL000129 [Loigolactobacillus rennini DSM 20253]
MNMKNESYIDEFRLFKTTETDYQKAFWYLIKTGWKFNCNHDYDEDYSAIVVDAPAMISDYFNLNYNDYYKVFKFSDWSLVNDVWRDAVEYCLKVINKIYIDQKAEEADFDRQFLTPYRDAAESEEPR